MKYNKACAGKNCLSVNESDHSEECIIEHNEIVHFGAGNRHPQARYAGYKGHNEFLNSDNADVRAAYQAGVKARERAKNE